MHRFFLLTICFGVASNALGNPTNKDTLKDTEFVIEKNRKNLPEESERLLKNAPTAPRVSEPVQLLPATPPAIWPPFDMLPRKVKLLRAKQDVVTPLYGNYMQGGHGNFYMPYLEGFLTNTRNPRYAYGLHFKHLSAGRAGYGEENHNLIQLHGKLFEKTLWHRGEIGYNGDSYPLYNPVKKQSIDHFVIRHSLVNYSDGPINYQVKSALHYVAAPEQVQETQGVLQGSGDYVLNDSFTLKAAADLHLTKYKDTARNLLRIKPTLSFSVQKFDIQGGLNLVYQNRDTQGVDPLNLYPILEIKYPLYAWLRPYVGIGGDVQQNSLRGLLQENPRLIANTELRHTNQRFLLYGGARGELVEQVSFHTGLLVGGYKNLHCFVNSVTDLSRFEVCYDSEATRWNVFGELTHANQAENWTTRLRGDYFHYALKDLPQPWHRPSYQLDLLSTYQWHDKVVFKGAIYCLGGITARNDTGKAVALPTVFDVDLGIDYLWNSRLSIFLDCQNLLAKRNERYLHYPDRGLQFVAGVTYGW